jgi:valyl-tRNA synthetase
MNVEGVPAKPSDLQTVDKWLLSRLVATEKEVKHAYEKFDLQAACQALYRFFWSEICDWYIEISKSRLQSTDQKETPQWVLLTAFEAFIKMLHPVMPFITEELYKYLPINGKAPFLMSTDWPVLGADLNHSAAEQEIESVFAATRALRALRAEIDLKPTQKVGTVYYEGDLKGNEAIVCSQAWVTNLVQGKPDGRFVSATSGGLDFHIAVEGLIDLVKVGESITRDLAKSTDDAEKLAARLSNPQFVERAKPDVIERDRTQLAELQARIEKLMTRQALLGN